MEWKDVADVALALLSQCFPGSPARYARLHERNPAGPGALWLARAGDGRAVGTAAVHARSISVDGQPHRAGLAADFAVDPAVRGFGPAVALQRAVVGACDSGEFAVLYGFPNRAALPVFQRVGYRVGATRRVARPLHSGRYLQRSGWLVPVTRPLAATVDLAVRLMSRETFRWATPDLRLERVEAFDAEFDRFWARVRTRDGVVGDRDSDYMNWRYVTWPTRRYERAVLRRGGSLAGSIVWYRVEDIAYIADLQALDATAAHALLAGFLRAQRQAGAAAASCIVLGDAGFATRLARYGFFRREVERTMTVYVPPASPLLGRVDRPERWRLFEGDIL